MNSYRVSGRYALFSIPSSSMGIDKASYQCPTYEALKGITSNIYWKPTLTWIIDKVRIINPIRTESKSVKIPFYNKEGCDIATYVYLKDVEYQVLAHFEWNMDRPDLENDRIPQKHQEIMTREINRGGRLPIFLGCSECGGLVESCEFGDGPGFYDNYGEIDMGLQFRIEYSTSKRREMIKVFDRVTMKNGIITFRHPNDFSPTEKEKIRNSAYVSIRTKRIGEGE